MGKEYSAAEKKAMREICELELDYYIRSCSNVRMQSKDCRERLRDVIFCEKYACSRIKYNPKLCNLCSDDKVSSLTENHKY